VHSSEVDSGQDVLGWQNPSFDNCLHKRMYVCVLCVHVFACVCLCTCMRVCAVWVQLARRLSKMKANWKSCWLLTSGRGNKDPLASKGKVENTGALDQAGCLHALPLSV